MQEEKASLLDQAGLERMAVRFAETVRPGDAFFLTGSLGAGKSVFARALLRGLGVEGNIPSPSFIVNAAYSVGDVKIHHIDLFRLAGSPGELVEYGIEDALTDDSVVVVEWADRLEMPQIDRVVSIRIDFTDQPMERSVTVHDRRMAGD